MNGGKRITLVPSGGIPVTFVDYGGQRVTEIESGGQRVTEVAHGGKRVTRVGESTEIPKHATATIEVSDLKYNSATITYSLTLNDDESAVLALKQTLTGDLIAEGTFTEDVVDAIYNAVGLLLNTNYSVYLNDVEIASFRTIS